MAQQLPIDNAGTALKFLMKSLIKKNHNNVIYEDLIQHKKTLH